MLSDVPLARLLEGMAAALREHVEPALDDEFGLMQVRAAGELLRNLAGRTEWSVRERADESADRAALVERLARVGWPAEIGGSGAAEASLTEALSWAQGAGDGARRIATEYLRAHNESERQRLKSGMYD
jgi:hypothetical protein